MTPIYVARMVVLGLAVTALATPSVLAQDYPTRPVTIVVPFAAGGGTDMLGRMVGQKLEQRLGKSFLIENKPGAGSTTGANVAAKAAPDGYTLLMAPSPTMAVSVTIYKNLPYDPLADFIPLALVAQTPFILIVNPSLPIHSVQELIKYAKDNPGKLSYGSAGPGTPHHLYAELFKSMTGIAISTKTRLASFPDIAPVGETVPGFDAASWQMLVAPAKTPGPIVDKLHAEVKAILATSEIKDRIINDGMLL